MKLLNTSLYEEKKSKFLGFCYQLDDIAEVKEILKTIRIEHKKAKHIVYAYKFNNTGGKSDDKEPQNTAGLPLYNYLEYQNLNNTLIVVVRYFGNHLLGVGNLKRAYLKAGMDACPKNTN